MVTVEKGDRFWWGHEGERDFGAVDWAIAFDGAFDTES